MSKFKRDSERIAQLGHRSFVGGEGQYWDEISRLQYDLLISNGLRSNHVVLDIACGSLRAGKEFIRYLNQGHYLGIDKEIDLIILGVACELGVDEFKKKRPIFVVSAEFDFSGFPVKPDYVIAQSLFTHLTESDIALCLRRLREFIDREVSFFATFFEVDTAVENQQESDAIDCFFYTRDQMDTLAKNTGWNMTYVGDWGHPRGQHLLRFTNA